MPEEEARARPRISKNRKLLAISSGGGHWIELLLLREAFASYDVLWATVDPDSRNDVPGKSFHTVPDATRWARIGLIRSAWAVLRLLCAERPDVVVTTGAAPGLFGVVLGKLFGARTIWIDSIANGERISLSGRLARRFADFWLTQWPELATPAGPRFAGAVL
ncbi:MAG: UDP-N-acetylglucosamine--LPS N-acetylglucosamine transferase [Planctomycetota bacterium]